MGNAAESIVTKVVSKNITSSTKKKTAATTAATGAGIYGVATVTNLAAGGSLAALGVEATVLAACAGTGLIVGAVGLGAYKAYKMYKHDATESESTIQKLYNYKVQIFNDTKATFINEFRKFQLIQNNIKKEELNINNNFKFERENKQSKVIVAIGLCYLTSIYTYIYIFCKCTRDKFFVWHNF